MRGHLQFRPTPFTSPPLPGQARSRELKAKCHGDLALQEPHGAIGKMRGWLGAVTPCDRAQRSRVLGFTEERVRRTARSVQENHRAAWAWGAGPRWCERRSAARTGVGRAFGEDRRPVGPGAEGAWGSGERRGPVPGTTQPPCPTGQEGEIPSPLSISFSLSLFLFHHALFFV